MSSKLVFTFLISVALIASIGCTKDKTVQYAQHLGDIPFQSASDNPNFKLCKPDSVIHSRLSLSYQGGWRALEKECLRKYKYQPEYSEFSGYVMVHFLVNCKYEMDRFRFEVMDFDFTTKEFPKDLPINLIAVVRSLDKWQRTPRYTETVDCSKYLNFKIVDGQIKNIIH